MCNTSRSPLSKHFHHLSLTRSNMLPHTKNLIRTQPSKSIIKMYFKIKLFLHSQYNHHIRINIHDYLKRCEFCFLKSQCKETVSIKSTFVNPANLFRMKVSKLQYCVITAKSLVRKQNNLHTKPSRNSCTTYIL